MAREKIMALALNIMAVGFAAMAAMVAIIVRRREERDQSSQLFSERELRKQQKRHWPWLPSRG